MHRSDNFLPRVLLVEDEPLTRQQLGELLEEWPARIFLAENGEQGLSLYREILPDIVVTDIVMPVINGIEMVRQIRKTDPKARIIGITAYGKPEDSGAPGELVADYYVMKPIDMDRLFEVMSQCKKRILEEREA